MTSISTFGQSLSQIRLFKQLQSNFGILNTQLATGKKTQKFSGLEQGVMTSQRSRTDLKNIDSYLTNAVNGERRIQQTLTGIKGFQDHIKSFYNTMIGFAQKNTHQQGDVVYYDNPLTPDEDPVAVGHSSASPDVDLSTLQSMAETIYDFVYELLNIKDGDRYLMGGAETSTPPISDNGMLDSAISTLIGNWKDETSATNISTTNLIDALKGRDASVDADAITDAIVGYSSSLSAGNAGKVYVRVDDNIDVDYTALANEQGFRDVLVALSFFKSPDLGPIADTYIPPNEPPGTPDVLGAPGSTLEAQKENFFRVFNEMSTVISNAIKDIDRVRYDLEMARSRVQEVKQTHKETKNLLLGIISQAEDVDTTEVAVKVNYLQIQLEASYRVTASANSISLVNFL